MEGIRARAVTKRFASVTALFDVSLDVAPAEVLVLLGPNGAGKSTLLRILGTTIIADSGEVIVAGHSVTTAPAAVRRSIGLRRPYVEALGGLQADLLHRLRSARTEVQREDLVRLVHSSINAVAAGLQSTG